MIKAATDVRVLGKRKACELKEALTKLGFSVKSNERKGVLQDKYDHACALLDLRLVDEDHTWTREEYDMLTKDLVDTDTNDWDAGEVYQIRNIHHEILFRRRDGRRGVHEYDHEDRATLQPTLLHAHQAEDRGNIR